jgi:hypothetical protein
MYTVFSSPTGLYFVMLMSPLSLYKRMVWLSSRQ